MGAAITNTVNKGRTIQFSQGNSAKVTNPPTKMLMMTKPGIKIHNHGGNGKLNGRSALSSPLVFCSTIQPQIINTSPKNPKAAELIIPEAGSTPSAVSVNNSTSEPIRRLIPITINVSKDAQ
jgi:hypothetical protein